MTDSVADLVQVIAHEREGRDRGWWDQMAGCYHPDSRVRSMWFTGSGRGFRRTPPAAWQRAGTIPGTGCRFPPCTVHGQRAVVAMPMAIEFRIELHGVEADLVSYARGIYRLERRDDSPRFAICRRSTSATPSRRWCPAIRFPSTASGWRRCRPAIECWPTTSVFADTTSTRTCPATIDRTSADALLTEAFDWLNDTTPRKGETTHDDNTDHRRPTRGSATRPPAN